MAIGMMMELPGGTQELYDRILDELDWKEQDYPDGLIAHYAGPGEGSWVVFDVWESREQFDLFAHERLMPAMQQASGSEVPQAQPRFIEIYNEDHPPKRVEI